MSKAIIQGAGWINAAEWGGTLQGQHGAYGEGAGLPPWKDAGLFPVPIKNIGRFTATSRLTLCACALALRDAGMSAGAGARHDVGLISTNEEGCLGANRTYFADYLAGGRMLARSSLFVNTLPSSPLAEAAIHFGFQGPILYSGCPGGGLAELLNTAAMMVSSGESAGMLAVRADERAALAVYLGAGTDGGITVDHFLKGFGFT